MDDLRPAPPPSGTAGRFWRGRSGRVYRLAAGALQSFALSAHELHVLVRGDSVLWAGSSGDVVSDPVHRARFRSALTAAEGVFTLEGHFAESERLTLAWDLEGGERIGSLSLA